MSRPRVVVFVAWLDTDTVGPADVGRLVADVADLDPQDVRIVHACRTCGSDRHGQPHVVAPAADRPWHLSVSRSGGRTVVAVTDAGAVGVDVEAVPGSDDDLLAWVRAESLVKATGHGLTIDPAELDDVARTTVDLEAPAGFVAALTVLGDTALTISAWPEAPAG